MKSDKELDGWNGAVKRVVMERANFFERAGAWISGPREVDVSTSYDESGRKIAESYGNNVIFGFEGLGQHVDARLNAPVDSRLEENRNEKITYKMDGTIGERTVYNYDLQGKEIEMSKYGHDNRLISKITYTNEYDTQGNIIQRTVERQTNVNGQLICEPLFIVYYDITYY